MKNAKKHKEKFFISPEKISEAFGGGGSTLGLICSRRDAKALIDDLTDKEFEVLAALLGHFSMLDEKFPTDEDAQRVREEIHKFFAGGPKTVRGIFWKKGAGDSEAAPCLYFDDGTFFEIINLVSVPGQLRFNWGKR
ncbi:MAG: hypothetical protein HY813_02005 [Candidatus Portnoybacteria bacterium]|nr:hypothetical protein [Candidatus Portnoybacteria bacterium]